MLQAYRQHSAERAALGIPPLPLSAQSVRDGHGVGEGRHLAFEPTRFVPPATQLATPTHMRNGIHDPAIEQAQSRNREIGIARNFISPVCR